MWVAAASLTEFGVSWAARELCLGALEQASSGLWEPGPRQEGEHTQRPWGLEQRSLGPRPQSEEQSLQAVSVWVWPQLCHSLGGQGSSRTAERVALGRSAAQDRAEGLSPW